MTMPTPERLGKFTDRLVAAAQACVAEPDSIDARRAYIRAAFNIDWTAAAIVELANKPALSTAPQVDRDRSREEPCP